MKKVKYIVSTEFADYKLGQIITGYVLVEDGDNALIYFPKLKKNRDFGVLEICKKVGEFYQPSYESFLMLSDDDNKKIKLIRNLLIGLDAQQKLMEAQE